jgi:uncharacterized protein (DUF58 family)
MRPWQYIALIVITGVIAVAVGWQPLWALTYALGLSFVLSVLWLFVSTRGLTFSRSAFGGRAQVGQRIEERLELDNHSTLPKLWVQVTDGSSLPGHHAGYVASIGPRQRITWRAKTVCRRRGRYTLGPVTATTGDPLGLFRRELELAPEQELLVLPTVLPLSTLPLYPGVMPGHGRGSQRSLQTTTNVVTVREYVAGDALARIHWPSTARLGQFMVKEFDLDPTIDVFILLDLDRTVQAGEDESSTEEYGVTITASIASYLLRQQEIAVALTVNGSPEGPLPLDRGERQLDRMLEMLAVVHAQRLVSLEEALVAEGSRLARHTVLIVITPDSDLSWPQGLAQLQRRGVRPYVILLDPHSFDENRFRPDRAHDALVALGVPVVGVKRGDPLVHILEQGSGL